MNKPCTQMGRDELVARVAELEKELASARAEEERWRRRLKELEQRQDHAIALLLGR